MWGGTCTSTGVGVGMAFMAFESRCFQRPEDSVGCPGDKVTDSSESPYLDAGNQTPIPQDSIKHS